MAPDRIDRTETAVRDADGTALGAIDYTGRARHVVLAGGERIPLATTGFYAFRRYRLGDDLLVARATWWVPFREFTARVSPELAGRPDNVFLVALASVLTHWSIAQEAYMRSMQDGRGLP